MRREMRGGNLSSHSMQRYSDTCSRLKFQSLCKHGGEHACKRRTSPEPRCRHSRVASCDDDGNRILVKNKGRGAFEDEGCFFVIDVGLNGISRFGGKEDKSMRISPR